MVAVALTVAGSDPSGGAGIQADLKTFHQHQVYGCAVISLLTVQNTTALRRVHVLDAELVDAQLAAVLEDIPPSAAKTGALGSAAIVEVIARHFKTATIPLVVDPVRIAKHAALLISEDARDALIDRLLPLATLVTANAPEAAWLARLPVTDEAQAIAAAGRLCALGARAVLVKGGHLAGPDAADLLLVDGALHRLATPRLAAQHTHGVGCSLSAAITANLARGLPLTQACRQAKSWLTRAIAGAPGVGHGVGAVDHFASLDAPEPD
jgi:hydroxymethylpyrimidine/phosphomethylpyrimidine kinase